MPAAYWNVLIVSKWLAHKLAWLHDTIKAILNPLTADTDSFLISLCLTIMKFIFQHVTFCIQVNCALIAIKACGTPDMYYTNTSTCIVGMLFLTSLLILESFSEQLLPKIKDDTDWVPLTWNAIGGGWTFNQHCSE